MKILSKLSISPPPLLDQDAVRKVDLSSSSGGGGPDLDSGISLSIPANGALVPMIMDGIITVYAVTTGSTGTLWLTNSNTTYGTSTFRNQATGGIILSLAVAKDNIILVAWEAASIQAFTIFPFK